MNYENLLLFYTQIEAIKNIYLEPCKMIKFFDIDQKFLFYIRNTSKA